MDEASRLFRDKPLSALETGKFWVEYVLRNKNMTHIQSASLLLNFIELHNVDVYVILAIIILLCLTMPIYFLKLIISGLKSKKCSDSSEKKSN